MSKNIKTSKTAKILMSIVAILWLAEWALYLGTGLNPGFDSFRRELYLYVLMTVLLGDGILQSTFVGEYILLLYGGVVITLMFGPNFIITYFRSLQSPLPSPPKTLMMGLQCTIILIICVIKIVSLKIKRQKQNQLN